MRDPLYKTRPIEPHAAKFGGERINDFIVMSEGNSNAYLIQTSAGNIQVNAGMFYEANVHEQNFDAFSTDPVRYLILTQGHVDHVGGVQHFRNKHPGLDVIATAANDEHQTYDARLAPFRRDRSMFAFLQKTKDALAYLKDRGITEHARQDRPTPDITFEDRYAFELGGLEVELIAVPGAETNDSLIIWLPQHKICLTGNLFGCPFGHFPNLITIRGDRYRDALTCAAAVDRVRQLGAETILYGHFAPIVGAELIRTELDCLYDSILHVHDATVRGMNEGKDVHTLMQEISIPAEIEVGEGYGKVSWGVRAIWEHYAGWFHHASTTELYSVPQSSIRSDLVDLVGGPGALVERAAKKRAEGRLEEALHLLDIALGVAPDHSEALAISIAAHEELLSKSQNFWLSSWLRHQIDTLGSRRTA
jgi:alkyl sulfatase BDS1-like metallo-beta-lactamase superfamily hydrolase